MCIFCNLLLMVTFFQIKISLVFRALAKVLQTSDCIHQVVTF